ncbi:MAG: hypothetical protein HC778_06430 [Chamaesiphon sp. CSU_1_12]|nr:hypothetical protein [Chamaesiphon sp. CSU_1_12]
MWVIGNEVAAIEIFDEICSVPMPTDGDKIRNRLTQIMNFGELLTTVSEFDRAEQKESICLQVNYAFREFQQNLNRS